MQEGLLRVVGLDYRGTLPPSAFLVGPPGVDDISIIFSPKNSHTGVNDLFIIFYKSQKTQVRFVNSALLRSIFIACTPINDFQ